MKRWKKFEEWRVNPGNTDDLEDWKRPIEWESKLAQVQLAEA